jgi:hypothetical protein
MYPTVFTVNIDVKPFSLDQVFIPEFFLRHNTVNVVPVSETDRVVFWDNLNFDEDSLEIITRVFYDPFQMLEAYYKKRKLFNKIIYDKKISWTTNNFVVYRSGAGYYLTRESQVLVCLKNYRAGNRREKS